ncbi:MAG: type II toxin-antitoxin system VapC family toxin [Solirubrobacterales bacterium]|nr:type II toxin-antitoxin system VapC family toxin [Solirubrobacterales bacterium]
MRVFLDSQALLLWTIRPHELPVAVETLLDDPATEPLLSAASLWELAIKFEAGKLEVPEGYFDSLIASGLSFLRITEAHGLAAGRLPQHHRDPFDRVIIAQAQAERLPLVGGDRIFASYDVRVIW